MTSASSMDRSSRHPIDFLGGGDGLDLSGGIADILPVGAGMAQFRLPLSLDHLLDTGAPGDHRQVGGKGADSLEASEMSWSSSTILKEDFGSDVLLVGLGDDLAPRMSSHMLDAW